MSGNFEKILEYKGLYESQMRKYVVLSATFKNQLNNKDVNQFSLFTTAAVVSLSLYKDKQTTVNQHVVEMLIT